MSSKWIEHVNDYDEKNFVRNIIKQFENNKR